MKQGVGYPLDPLTGKEIKYLRIEAISTVLTLFFGFLGAFYCSSRIAFRVFLVDIVSAGIFGFSFLTGMILRDTVHMEDLGFIIIGLGALILLSGIILTVVMVFRETKRINEIWLNTAKKKEI